MKISASVFSNKDRPLASLVQEVESCGIDYIHVDCNDDPNVGAAIAEMRKASDLPIDLHIISPEPEKYYDMIREHGVEMVTLQYEDLGGRVPEMPDLGCKWGLSIVTETPLSAFEAFSETCAFILLMTTTPGQSGGRFNKANFRKIRQFRRVHPEKRIHVDGGVNAEISFILRNMGVYCAVSGSFLVNAASIPRAFLELLFQKGENPTRVADFMHEIDELPVLTEDEMDLQALLREVERCRMGYCLLTDAEGKFTGLSSNADIRRGMLAHIHDLNGIELPSLVNRNPKRIQKSATVTEMLRFVKSFDFLVLYLPVVDENGKLVGAVNFNHLILGEL